MRLAEYIFECLKTKPGMVYIFSTMILDRILKLQEGYSVGLYKGEKYSIVKKTLNEGKSFKVFAEQLGGNDFISLNYYITSAKEWLKPCEMPEEKVIDFLMQVEY